MYKLLRNDSPDGLADMISGYLSDGWDVQGSPFYNTHNAFYYQAIIRRPNEK